MSDAGSSIYRNLGRLGDLPRARLCHVPTPIEPMPNLGARLGDVRLYVKRDDCTGLALGGNKVRQLEFYLGEARAGGADTVLITGAVQSNFARLAAAAAEEAAERAAEAEESEIADEDAGAAADVAESDPDETDEAPA